MPAKTASASAKLILLGEHAVVYGHPAIAIPFSDIRLHVTVEPAIFAKPGTLRVISSDMQLDQLFDEMSDDQPIKQMIILLLEYLGIKTIPSCTLRISSQIPLGAGFGSSAALAVGLMRALSAYLGHFLAEKELDQLAYQSEQFIHGRLSGIDTTVIAWEQAIYYQRGHAVEVLKPLNTLHFVVADSGERTPTSQSVAYLAMRLEREEGNIKPKLHEIEKQVMIAKRALHIGDIQILGETMNHNQNILFDLGLSSPMLDKLCSAACEAGAFGAKLSGGGQGGAMIALIEAKSQAKLTEALKSAGAVDVWSTSLPGNQLSFPSSLRRTIP